MNGDKFTDISQLVGVEKEKLEQIYKLAEIQAISQIKGTIFRWAGGWIAVVSVALAALAFFGFDQLVLNKVNTMVDDKVKVHENKFRELDVSYITLHTNAQGVMKRMTKLSESFNPILKNLVEIDKRGKLGVALHRIIADFYIIRDIKVWVRVDFSSELVARAMPLTIDLFNAEKPNVSIAQFSGQDESMTMLIDENEVPYGIAYSAYMFPPFREKLYNTLVEDLKFDSVKFRRATSNESTAVAVVELFKKIKNIGSIREP